MQHCLPRSCGFDHPPALPSLLCLESGTTWHYPIDQQGEDRTQENIKTCLFSKERTRNNYERNELEKSENRERPKAELTVSEGSMEKTSSLSE